MIIIGTFINKDEINKEFVDDFYGQLEKSKDTMGKLLNKVKSIYSISDEHIEGLSEILELRNYLIHRFFKTNSYKWYTDEGKLEMILECNSFVEKTTKIDNQLEGYFTKHLKHFGITEEVLRSALQAKKNQEINKIKK